MGILDFVDPMTNEVLHEELYGSNSCSYIFSARIVHGHIVSYHFTRDVTSIQIMPIFWKAAAVLELLLMAFIIWL